MNNSLPAAGNQLYSLTFSALERGSWWCLKWFSKPQHFRLNLQTKGNFSELRSAWLKQWPSFPTWMAQNFSARRTRNTQRFPPEVTSVTSKRIHGIGSQVLFPPEMCLPSQFCRAQVGKVYRESADNETLVRGMHRCYKHLPCIPKLTFLLANIWQSQVCLRKHKEQAACEHGLGKQYLLVQVI